MRKDATILQERVGVAHVERSGRRVAHMGDKRCAGSPMGVGGEFGILPRRDGFLVQPGLPLFVKDTQARAVGVAAALLDQAVRRVQQPKRRGDDIRASVQAKESTHGPDGTEVQSVSCVERFSSTPRA